MLLYKLCGIGVNGNFFNVVKSMYIENDLNVRIGDVLTKSFHLERGVRQGDNLSPNLFKICINDLPKIFNGDDAPVDLNCYNPIN